MSLQTIIDSATTVQIIKRRLSGQTITRSGQVKINTVASSVPFQFKVAFRPGLRYSENRALVESLDTLDRQVISNISIGNTNPGLAYITRYQGDFTTLQLSAVSVISASDLNITLDISTLGGNISDFVFRKGDYVQLANGYKYPYTVTADVTKGSGSTLNVPINRPFIEQSGYTVAGADIVVGSAVSWQVVITSRPDARVLPYDLLDFNGEFEMIEVVED